jgi:hypothetical protein
MRIAAVVGQAGCRFLLVTMLAAFAAPVPGRAQPGNPQPPRSQTTPPPASVDIFEQDVLEAIRNCRDAALLAIKLKLADAEAQKLNADVDCNGDKGCLKKNDDTFQNTRRELQKQSNNFDRDYKKQLAWVQFIFGNYISCSQNLESCPASLRTIFSKPVKQMTCEELDKILPVTTQ